MNSETLWWPRFPHLVASERVVLSQLKLRVLEAPSTLSSTSALRSRLQIFPLGLPGLAFLTFFTIITYQHQAACRALDIPPILKINFNPTPAAADFSLAVSSPSMHIHGGASSSVNLTVQPVAGGSVPTVGFDVSGAPSGVTSRITTNSAN